MFKNQVASARPVDARVADDRVLHIKVKDFQTRWWLLANDTVVKTATSKDYLEGWVDNIPKPLSIGPEASEPPVHYTIVDSYLLTGRKDDWNYR